MYYQDFQTWMNSKGQALVEDGLPGPASAQAIKDVFINTHAPAIEPEEIEHLAKSLGCTVDQLNAVATVESSGSGFDSNGRPKILFERHKFSSFTNHKYDVCSYSNPSSGGYSEDSWDKLTGACSKDIDAAFKSASWGKFQVMGFWFADFGFCSSLEMAYSCTKSEANQYALFANYIEVADLQRALQDCSSNPDDCRAFAKGYNGPAYEDGNYHVKIANELSGGVPVGSSVSQQDNLWSSIRNRLNLAAGDAVESEAEWGRP